MKNLAKSAHGAANGRKGASACYAIGAICCRRVLYCIKETPSGDRLSHTL